MGKKRRPIDKRAQITLFIIIGIVIFLAFLFLLQLSAGAKKAQLSLEQEKVFTKAFKKESLRIFVQDCLQDELERGLILLGRQGRIWSDQPGGVKPFEEGITGVLYAPAETVGDFSSGRVFYGITAEDHFQFPEAFPCDNESFAPEFCRYHYPNTRVGFGQKELFLSTFEYDLQQYLTNRTEWCVASYLHTNVSSAAVLQPSTIDLKLTLNEEGASLTINYPLRFAVGNEEFFHLSTFDFFYPTRFKQLLEAAVSKPLDNDQRFIDFNYSETTLQQPQFSYARENDVGSCNPLEDYFLCDRTLLYDSYRDLSTELDIQTLPNGDDVFIFTPALYQIVNSPFPYSLRIARQNRPPALDYINRSACPSSGYDYLVIQGHSQLGAVDITSFALDPDEDNVSYSFYSSLLDADDNSFSIDTVSVLDLSPGWYNITANATDQHGKSDWQTVRMLLDRSVRTAISLASPYPDIHFGLDATHFIVSREDPMYLQVTIPTESVTGDDDEAILFYNDGMADFGFPILSRPLNGDEVLCYNLPLAGDESASCVLTSYDTPLDFERIREGYASFYPFGSNSGTLSLRYGINYCGLFPEGSTSQAEVIVKECVPHQNLQHPFAYPYHGYTFESYNFNSRQGEFGGIIDDSSVNPFDATHSCCLGLPNNPSTWELVGENDPDHPCFINPQPGCYGQISEYTTLSGNDGYILEQQQRLCGGERGNWCNGEFQSALYNNELRCGENGENQCSGINSNCENELAFSLIEDEGWCHGRMGCAALCREGVVYTETSPQRIFSNAEISQSARELTLTHESDNPNFGFHCGCVAGSISNGGDDGRRCDANYDGAFDRRCSSGSCLE